MLLMATNRPPLFTVSDRIAEKRGVSWTLRLTGSERDALEHEAAKRGMSAINLIRVLIANGLLARRKTKR